MGHISFALLSLLFFLPGVSLQAADVPKPPHVSVVEGSAGETYRGHGHSRLAATQSAMQQCNAAPMAQSGGCEVIKVDELAIPSAASLRSDSADDRLFLWRYRNGPATVYLAGSVHLLKAGFYPLPRAYEAAFEQSDKLVVEVDVSAVDPAEIQQLPLQYGSLPRGSTLKTVLPPDVHAKLGQTMATYGLAIQQFENFKPALVTQQLVVLAMLSAGYQAEYGVEQHFLRKRGSREVLQLESLPFQLDLLFNVPLATQRVLTEDTLAIMPHFPDAMSDLIAAWHAGDDQRLMQALNDQQGESAEAKAWNEALLDQRNEGMAEQIKGYLDTEGTYFVLVGTAHLAGPRSIPALLNDHSFEVERLRRNATLRDTSTSLLPDLNQ